METLYLPIILFLILLAIVDLVVGVSNDAVNFLNSAVGARVARFRTIVAISAVGVFAGAAMSNGMMDVARHGIMTPAYFSFHDVVCVFLAVMVTDVILLDIFNTLGMPTSTTVSMVFELLGGSFAIALLAIAHGATGPDGALLTLGDMLNTEKALSVILAIFLSVAVAFVFGTIVQWIARLVFTFTYRVNGITTDAAGRMGSLPLSSVKIGIFGGLAVTSIIWFLLINGLKNSTFMTPEVKAFIASNTWLIVGSCVAFFSVVMTLLSALKVPVLKGVVLLGTFALAMAFAGNDLVNFIGVPLTGLEAYQDYRAAGAPATAYMMTALMESAKTPTLYLLAAGLIMVLSLVFSKKAQNVVKTSVDLSRQDEGDEMFGSSAVARVMVRTTTRTATALAALVPKRLGRWIDSRFNSDMARPAADGAAFDHIRASVNLVLAGLLVALGTSLKLPLSTTYVTFMVAMGASLADRAWSRDSAVFRITGVLSVIGGWFITAGVAFIVCFVITNIMHYGGMVAMIIAVIIAVALIVRSNIAFARRKPEAAADTLLSDIRRVSDRRVRWQMLTENVTLAAAAHVGKAREAYERVTDAFFHEEYRALRRTSSDIDDDRQKLKRERRRQIIALRKTDKVLAVERNTWYFLTINAVEQLCYCLKRIAEPCREHVSNNFTPLSQTYVAQFLEYRFQIVQIMARAEEYLSTPTQEGDVPNLLRTDAMRLQGSLSTYRKQVIDDIQRDPLNIQTMTVFLNIVQESQELLSALRHLLRGISRLGA